MTIGEMIQRYGVEFTGSILYIKGWLQITKTQTSLVN